MTVVWWQWLSILGLPTAAGALWLRLLGRRFRDDRCAFLGWAYLVGTLALTMAAFGLLSLGLGIRPAFLGAAGLSLLLPVVLTRTLARRQPSAATTAQPVRGPAAGLLENAFFVAVVVLTSLVTVVRALESDTRPILRGDEALIWSAKAKTIWAADGFGDDLRQVAGNGGITFHADYPPLNPLLQVWTFLHAGGIVHIDNRVPIQAFMLALTLALAAALRRMVRPAIAAVLLFLVVGCPRATFLSQFAYSDHMVALGFLVGLDGWWRYRRGGDAADFRLACCGLGFALWSKNEAYLLLAAIAAAAALGSALGSRDWRHVKALGRSAAWLLVPVVLATCHLLHNRHFGFHNDLAGGHGGKPVWASIFDRFDERFGIVSEAFATMLLVNPPLPFPFGATQGWFLGRHADHNLLIAAFLLLALAFPRRLTGRDGMTTPALAVVLALVGFFCVYLGSFQDIVWHLGTSLNRVLFGLVPAATLWVAAAITALVSPSGQVDR